jgi:hydroxymethylpyrimidine/phosphomethylpyrimidine kinase
MIKRIMIIAGSDSGGGAGIQADIKTVTMLGGYAMTAITAITAQNTLGVDRVFALPADLVQDQFNVAISDIGVDAIKIGMLARPETVLAVRDLLYTIAPEVPIVIDPVMFATSGDALNETGTLGAMHELLAMATLITPNLAEYEALGGTAVVRGLTLITGREDDDGHITDQLIGVGGEIARWSAKRIETTSTHGTGCTLATAIATGLGQGLPLEAAIERAREFVRAALLAAPGFGKGQGPMGHHAVRFA